MSAKQAFVGELPPEALNAALGLATLGTGGGIASGVVADKPLDQLASDLASGVMGGAAGGGTLGAGLALLGKGLPAGNILAKNPLGLALLMSGAGAGLGALLKGAKDRPQELPIQAHPALAASKIGSQRAAELEDELRQRLLEADEHEDDRPPKQAFQQQPGQPLQQPQSENQQILNNQRHQAIMQHVLMKRQKQMADKQELARRESLGRSVGGPIGGFLGKHLGNAVSSIAGERPADGIRGWFGVKERRIDPETAKEVGSALGNLGGSQFGAQLARRMQANPTADMYMDQLGL